MEHNVKEMLIDRIDIRERVWQIGYKISREYEGMNPIIIGILKGSFIFMADLIRNIDIRCQVDFMEVSSYGSGTRPTGPIRIGKDVSIPIKGRHIILVDDILDSGNTLFSLKKLLAARQPASIRVAVLLDKPSRREKEITADYIGFEIPDYFVVGYGLDYDDEYRNLDYIGILKPEVYRT